MTTGAEQGEIAEVGSPVHVPADPVDARAPLGWATGVVATAAVFLALTNAPTASAWLDGLPQGPLTERLRPAITAWVAATDNLDGPHRWVAARWQALRGWRFGDEEPGEQGANDAP